MKSRPTIGIALGGGAARGWAHIGVLRALAAHGIVPDVVTGTSIGALVGAAFAADRLDALEAWVTGLGGIDVLRLLDGRLAGGVIGGDRAMQAVERIVPDVAIEALPRRFAAVATDLRNGRAVWLREGSTLAAVRASSAMPGLMRPRRHEAQWLVDGGLVDPVPVTLCRVMGADVVIAVDVGAYRRRFRQSRPDSVERNDLARNHADGDRDAGDPAGGLPAGTPPAGTPPAGASAAEGQLSSPAPHGSSDAGNAAHGNDSQGNDLRGYVERLQAAVSGWFETPEPVPREPGLLDVVVTAINIMQQSITRSRLAGDPPDLELVPDVGGIGLLEFHKAREAIDAGARAVAERAAEVAALARL